MDWRILSTIKYSKFLICFCNSWATNLNHSQSLLLYSNVTYLNPAKHKHIPRPPAGVVIPPKVLGPLDTKPFPVLWHEDNSGRRQNGRERPSVPGAMVGPMLGEAAHRLVKSTLNIKLNNNQSSGILEPPRNRNFLGYYAVNRPRPAAPSGYERGFSEDTHQYHGNHNYTII
ncbi:5'-3' exoribonuclease 4-like isoform X2 [Syzygium oleosum]|uniref:5'-3' exoribonuclease 4-like isoform X2 n=1 Tax=Syzygium oleosum TaxID=219896 RepID=UPI0024B9BCD1|nr:5'-3' exoribonuclease 4-like isoform X2 [Syzygium oleosum]XP_056172532.1 5'-3' exoribonuclease 4-like isoform X2 [Syzygium oleosum]